MGKQRQSGDGLPVEYVEDEFVIPEKVNDRFVDYGMTKQEGKEILRQSGERNDLNEQEKQVVLLQDLKAILGRRLSQVESEQFYEKPESIWAA
jgi:hypothetical protein